MAISADLTKFHSAFEWALMKFHKEKMAVINNMVREMWHNTYRGNDIDYIEIRAEESEARASKLHSVLLPASVYLVSFCVSLYLLLFCCLHFLISARNLSFDSYFVTIVFVFMSRFLLVLAFNLFYIFGLQLR